MTAAPYSGTPLCSVCYGTEVPSPGDVCDGCLGIDQLAQQVEFPREPLPTVRLDIGPDDPRYQQAVREAIDPGPETRGQHWWLECSSVPNEDQLDNFWRDGWAYLDLVRDDRGDGGWLLLLRRRAP